MLDNYGEPTLTLISVTQVKENNSFYLPHSLIQLPNLHVSYSIRKSK